MPLSFFLSLMPNFTKHAITTEVKEETIDPKINKNIDLYRQRGVDCEAHLMADHDHMCLRVPPQLSIAFVIGFLNGKSAARIHRKQGISG